LLAPSFLPLLPQPSLPFCHLLPTYCHTHRTTTHGSFTVYTHVVGTHTIFLPRLLRTVWFSCTAVLRSLGCSCVPQFTCPRILITVLYLHRGFTFTDYARLPRSALRCVGYVRHLPHRFAVRTAPYTAVAPAVLSHIVLVLPVYVWIRSSDCRATVPSTVHWFCGLHYTTPPAHLPVYACLHRAACLHACGSAVYTFGLDTVPFTCRLRVTTRWFPVLVTVHSPFKTPTLRTTRAVYVRLVRILRSLRSRGSTVAVAAHHTVAGSHRARAVRFCGLMPFACTRFGSCLWFAVLVGCSYTHCAHARTFCLLYAYTHCPCIHTRTPQLRLRIRYAPYRLVPSRYCRYAYLPAYGYAIRCRLLVLLYHRSHAVTFGSRSGLCTHATFAPHILTGSRPAAYAVRCARVSFARVCYASRACRAYAQRVHHSSGSCLRFAPGSRLRAVFARCRFRCALPGSARLPHLPRPHVHCGYYCHAYARLHGYAVATAVHYWFSRFTVLHIHTYGYAVPFATWFTVHLVLRSPHMVLAVLPHIRLRGLHAQFVIYYYTRTFTVHYTVCIRGLPPDFGYTPARAAVYVPAFTGLVAGFATYVPVHYRFAVRPLRTRTHYVHWIRSTVTLVAWFWLPALLRFLVYHAVPVTAFRSTHHVLDCVTRYGLPRVWSRHTLHRTFCPVTFRFAVLPPVWFITTLSPAACVLHWFTVPRLVAARGSRGLPTPLRLRLLVYTLVLLPFCYALRFCTLHARAATAATVLVYVPAVLVRARGLVHSALVPLITHRFHGSRTVWFTFHGYYHVCGSTVLFWFTHWFLRHGSRLVHATPFATVWLRLPARWFALRTRFAPPRLVTTGSTAHTHHHRLPACRTAQFATRTRCACLPVAAQFTVRFTTTTALPGSRHTPHYCTRCTPGSRTLRFMPFTHTRHVSPYAVHLYSPYTPCWLVTGWITRTFGSCGSRSSFGSRLRFATRAGCCYVAVSRTFGLHRAPLPFAWLRFHRTYRVLPLPHLPFHRVF